MQTLGFLVVLLVVLVAMSAAFYMPNEVSKSFTYKSSDNVEFMLLVIHLISEQVLQLSVSTS